jgi:hypothetical protein
MVSINTETDFLFCRYASFSILEVTYAEPGVKINATNAATNVETETTVNVPLFIK